MAGGGSEETTMGAGTTSSGKLTTWSNIGTRPAAGSATRGREENNNNNDVPEGATALASDGGGGSGERRSRKSRSLDDVGGRMRPNPAADPIARSPNTEARLLTTFMKNRDGSGSRLQHSPQLDWEENNAAVSASASLVGGDVSPGSGGGIPMMRSKDTVNQFLKAAATRQLTSIEENSSSEQSPPVTETVPPSSSSKPPLPPRTHLKKGTASTPSTSSAAGASSSAPSVRNYPDLNFLENDVGLWDAFFLHSKNSSKFPSVLQGEQQARQPRSQPQPAAPMASRQTSAPVELPPPSPYTPGGSGGGKRHSIPVLDSESLRTLLPPSARRHLEQEDPSSASASPIAQVCQSMSRLASKNDLQNEAIKSMFGQQQQQSKAAAPEGASAAAAVKVVKVKEAWADVPEKEQVVLRKSSRREKDEKNMNLINNNGGSGSDASAKRRSYHPQDYLSQVLVDPDDQQQSSSRPRRRGRRAADFPKVYGESPHLTLTLTVHNYFSVWQSKRPL